MAQRTVGIIQARMSSSRLPGKVLLDIAGQPMLAHVVERAKKAKTLAEVVVATTTDPMDDAVAALCAERGYPCFRGSLHDVLDRYYQAAVQFDAEVVARITADCPLLDAGLVDDVVRVISIQYSITSIQSPSPLKTDYWLLNTEYFDFAANRLPPPWGRSYPIGLDVEVCTFAALERAWREASEPHHREHVMPYLYEERRSIHFAAYEDDPQHAWQTPPVTGDALDTVRPFKVLLLHNRQDYGTLRWTVDTPADLEFARQVYSRFAGRDDFGWREVLALVQGDPALAQINAQVQHKTYKDVDARR